MDTNNIKNVIFRLLAVFKFQWESNIKENKSTKHSLNRRDMLKWLTFGISTLFAELQMG